MKRPYNRIASIDLKKKTVLDADTDKRKIIKRKAKYRKEERRKCLRECNVKKKKMNLNNERKVDNDKKERINDLTVKKIKTDNSEKEIIEKM